MPTKEYSELRSQLTAEQSHSPQRRRRKFELILLPLSPAGGGNFTSTRFRVDGKKKGTEHFCRGIARQFI